MQAITTSKRWTLNLRDCLKGITVSVLTSVFTALISVLDNGQFFNWPIIWKSALAGFLGYLLKNLADKPKIVVEDATTEQVEAVKEGEAKVIIK